MAETVNVINRCYYSEVLHGADSDGKLGPNAERMARIERAEW